MSDDLRLPPDRLRRACRFGNDDFATTDDLAGTGGLIGQDRAREAIAYGLHVRGTGHHLFVLGEPGYGKRSLARELLDARAGGEPPPDDWCYVNDFAHPHKPQALRLPAGTAVVLRRDLQHCIEELRAAIPALFDSDEYRTRAEQISQAIDEETQQGFIDLGQDVAREGIALLHTPAGFTLAPMKDGEVMDPEAFGKLPEQERERVRVAIGAHQEALQATIRKAHRLQTNKRERLKALNREMTLATVGTLIGDLEERHATLPAVLHFLEEVQTAVLEDIDAFRRPPEARGDVPGLPPADPRAFQRYQVNVVVGGNGTPAGAPVVEEAHPTYPNLLGRIEHVAQFGALSTDFTLIKAGALHRANGGYLLLDAQRLLAQPYAWDGLKRALASGEIRVESLEHSLGLMSTVGLEPEPIPLDVKVVLFGERRLYYLLLAWDPAFGELFRVAADFEDEVERSADSERRMADFIAALVRRERLLALDRTAVARVIDESVRWTGDAERLSGHVERLSDLLRETDYVARSAGATVGAGAHVDAAVERQARRAGRVSERLRDAILRGTLFIASDGAVAGQVNGLSVSMLGTHAFGHPVRITATTRLGEGEVIDIQREVDLGGPLHSKGVLILGSLLAARYAADQPWAVTASIVFEQTYSPIEGDSASVAELAALLSSLGQFPLRQDLAVTGSVNQHGDVQPIGGVNEKIEGWFDICAARGLTGTQGVVIPAANRDHLMLRDDVVAAARAGRFHVYAVSTVDEALTLLSGLPAGVPDADGRDPSDSVDGRVLARLAALVRAQRAARGQDPTEPMSRPAARARRRPSRPQPKGA